MTKNNQSTKEETAVSGVETKPATKWYVVQSEPNRERQAKYYLEGNQFEVYLPMRLCAAKSKASMTPLFPRYMFVALDLESGHWPRVFSTPGVAAVLTHTTRKGSRPSQIPCNFVEGIREREIDGVLRLGGVQKAGAPLPFKAGDKVKVERGSNGGELDAVFLERVDANRVMILLSLIGRDSPVLVQGSFLKGS